MESQTVLVIFVVIAALAFAAQAAILYLLYLALRELPSRIEAIRAEIKEYVEPLSQSVSEILVHTRGPMQTITVNLAEVSNILRERAGHIDTVIAELVDRSRLQAIRVDHMISGLADKVENTADAVRVQVLAPIHEMSAVIKGVRSGLEFLFSRRRVSSVTEATQDEQMFI